MDSILFQADGLLTCVERHVWNGCVQGSLALLLVYAVCRLFPRIPPHAASWLWRLAYLKLLFALVFVGSLPLTLPIRVNGTPAVTVVNAVLMSSGVSNLTARTAHFGGMQIVVAILALFWYAGIVVSGIGILAASRKTRKMLHACTEVEDRDLRTELALLCSRMRIRRAPRLLSGDIDCPLVSGFTTASIILPNRMLAGSARAELRLALAHELAHIRRYDVAWAWLPMLASWFFFFHPLVWLLRKEWMVAQEAACDLLAIEVTNAHCADYSRMLLGCVVKARTDRSFATAGIAESHETLKRRIWAMATLRTASRKKKIAVGVAIGILAIVVIVPWMLGCRKPTSAEIANALPRAVYAKDTATFHRLCPESLSKEHPEMENTVLNDLYSRVQTYGAIKSVRLEAKGKGLPGLGANSGMSYRPGFVLPPGCDVSTWRVVAEHGEYRLILTTRDGTLVGCFFNLADGCIGTGESF